MLLAYLPFNTSCAYLSKKKIYSCLVFIYLSFVLELNYFVILKLEAASLIPEFLSFLRSSFNLVHIC